MTGWLLWTVTGLYGLAAASALREGHAPQAAMLAGYVIANLGLIWSLR